MKAVGQNVDLCQWIEKSHPFNKSSLNSPDFSSNTWNVCVLNSECQSGLRLAARLLGDSSVIIDSLPSQSIFAVYSQKEANHWEIAIIKASPFFKILPVQLEIDSGIIKSCVTGDELFGQNE
jgi:hypothetical protein